MDLTDEELTYCWNEYWRTDDAHLPIAFLAEIFHTTPTELAIEMDAWREKMGKE